MPGKSLARKVGGCRQTASQRHSPRACLLRAFFFVATLAICAGPTPGAVSSSPPVDRFADRALAPAAPTPARADDSAINSSAGPSVTRVVLSLVAVSLLVVALGWIGKRLLGHHRNSGGGVTLVSRTLLTPKHQVLVLRAGARLLIVGDSGHGMNLLCDIRDPQEIASFLGETATPSRTPFPDDQDEPFEQPPSLADTQQEVRSLIDRVRGLAGEAGGPIGAGERVR